VVAVSWVPIPAAWQEALYGVDGFYRRQRPADHFRTSSHTSPRFAGAVVELARRHDLTAVCDLGAGRGELLAQIHRLGPGLSLTGVEIGRRPEELPGGIGWERGLPSGFRGLIFANELLDNIPCAVVELDGDGSPRLVEVDPGSGEERLGAEAGAEQLQWLTTWWPLAGRGQRAEVGLTRDALWAELCTANPQSLCIAVDYGHVAGDRPIRGSLASYRGGVQTAVTYDGEHDITAHVAVDSVAAKAGGSVRRQREVLHDLGVSGGRPPIAEATCDPAGYLRSLARATESAELTALTSLGAFYWLSSQPASGGDRHRSPANSSSRPETPAFR